MTGWTSGILRRGRWVDSSKVMVVMIVILARNAFSGTLSMVDRVFRLSLMTAVSDYYVRSEPTTSWLHVLRILRVWEPTVELTTVLVLSRMVRVIVSNVVSLVNLIVIKLGSTSRLKTSEI